MIILKIILNSILKKSLKNYQIAKQNKNNKFQISSIKLE